MITSKLLPLLDFSSYLLTPYASVRHQRGHARGADAPGGRTETAPHTTGVVAL
jgi:hypothetical protein